MTKLKVLSLFAGIGGFDLGLERTGGFETVAFCEIEPFAVRVLNKNWPGVPVYGDVQELTADRLRADGVVPDVIVGGFPCQDISLAGKGAGLAGERSGLWSHYARLIGEIRPLYVIVENVAALLGRGLGDVLGDLAALGYDAEWHCIPASAVGAPHRRDRLWIVAYPNGGRGWADAARGNDANRNDAGRTEADGLPRTLCEAGRAGVVADAERSLQGRRGVFRPSENRSPLGEGTPARPLASGADVPDAYPLDAQGLLPRGNDTIVGREQIERQARLCGGAGGQHDWTTEPAVGRVAHGVPDRVGQLRAYGNAVVPQIPELIGRAILEARKAAA